MNALNNAFTRIFDVVLTPLEALGIHASLILVSGVFGVFALWLFKYISWQKGIGATKDKIKGHMIAIRLYQDDLAVVGSSVLKVLGRNFQYLALNFGPFIPLAIPFVFVAAQLVTRYGFDPVPVKDPNGVYLAGQGTQVKLWFDPNTPGADELRLVLPEGVVQRSPLVVSSGAGLAFVELLATAPGDHQLKFELPDGTSATKTISAGGEPRRSMQPERVRGTFSAMLWPAEDMLAADSPFQRIVVGYPERDLGWLPGGPLGVLITFVLASMAFGFAALKPLGVKI
ncbi:MAG: hypothetical protein H6831_13830 [Planctomycetes bacterium]|nr:hypothetical protein [Planctomycetota bacterium]MCB9905479.1 hypothetical protein [Planctomycetota bacterium]